MDNKTTTQYEIDTRTALRALSIDELAKVAYDLGVHAYHGRLALIEALVDVYCGEVAA